MMNDLLRTASVDPVTLGAFILTALVHSTVLLGGTWVLVRALRLRPRLEEVAWRAGIVASVFSALLASQEIVPRPLHVHFLGEELGLGSTPDQSPEFTIRNSLPEVAAFGTREEYAGDGVVLPAQAPTNQWGQGEAEGLGEASGRSSTSWRSGSAEVIILLAYLWLLGLVLMLMREVWGWCSVHWVFRDRQPLSAEQVLWFARVRDELGIGSTVVLSVSSEIRSPVALPGREICVPPFFFSELGVEQQRAALAHEIAHVVRYDIAWAFFVRMARAVMFLQPLAALAERKLAFLAEVNSDDWAAERSGADSLASSLAAMAAWCESSPKRTPLPAVGLAREPSSLVYRVRRLVQDPRAPVALGRWTTAIAAVAMVALGFGLPSLEVESTEAAEPLAGYAPSSNAERPAAEPRPQPLPGPWERSSSLAERWRLAASEALERGSGPILIHFNVDGPEGAAPLAVQIEAAIGADSAGPALEALAATSDPAKQSSRLTLASISLGTVHPDSSARWIRDQIAELARRGAQRELQRQLVGTLAAHRSSIGEAYLVRLAWIHPDAEIRLQAVEHLGDRSSERALRELMLMIERHPEAAVVERAVRAVATPGLAQQSPEARRAPSAGTESEVQAAANRF